MAKRFIDENTLIDIADAIREKTDGSYKIDPANYASIIRAIRAPSPRVVQGGVAYELSDNQFVYSARSQHIEIGPEVQILSYIDGMCVTTIKSYGFAFCSKITKLELGDGIRSIGDYAFDKCTNLSQIFLPASIEYISNVAFTNCPKLNDISYGGTQQQFNDKGLNGMWLPSAAKVTCTDGTFYVS